MPASNREAKNVGFMATLQQANQLRDNGRRLSPVPHPCMSDPIAILADRIDAKYENGILKLTLPKKEVKAAAPAKQIKVG